MWQIFKNSKQKQTIHKQADPSQEILKLGTVQCLQWKFGTVFVSDHQQLISEIQSNLKEGDLIITTPPFDSYYNISQSSVNIKTRHLHQRFEISDKLKQRIIVCPAGQQNKTLQTLTLLLAKMQEKAVNRSSTVYILGGGQLLDMAGFACSIYMRGIKKIIFVPTTLLSIVDATVGGKNGINFGGKNMLGVIKHAQQIRVSMHYLQTLTDRQFSNGLAQVIKMSITHDINLFQMLQSQAINLDKLRKSPQMLRQIIKKSLSIKISVVERDQFEHNQRQWLNFGHTVGHAIELSGEIDTSNNSINDQSLLHGECVAIGMLEQIRIGQIMGEVKDKSIYKRIEQVLKKFGLPTKIPDNLSRQQIIRLMTKDKKNKSERNVELTLVQQIGVRKQNTTSVPMSIVKRWFTKSIKLVLAQNNQKLISQLQKTTKQWVDANEFPPSKSLSIRYLFLAALHYVKYSKTIKIDNFLHSEDTLCLIQSLASLGFHIIHNRQQKSVYVQSYQVMRQSTLWVGNSGLTARFILPLAAHLKGKWTIKCHPRMSERPNAQIFNFCNKYYDCQFQWISGKQNTFPAIMTSKGLKIQNKEIIIQISSKQSSQFVSSILLNLYLWPLEIKNSISIKMTDSKIVSESYIRMTIGCLQKFNGKVEFVLQKQSSPSLTVRLALSPPNPNITIQQDLSSFSYPYALCLMHGATLPLLPQNSSQGDLLFYQYCKYFQNKNEEFPQYLQFSQCTDTFMTFAAILATNNADRLSITGKGNIDKKVKIGGIANQRVKQSNRIQMIKQNLSKIGYDVEQTQDGLIFNIRKSYKFKQFQSNQVIVFETKGDHRLAMSMTILLTYLLKCQDIRKKGVQFVIDDKNAVNKTFPNFWKYIQQLGVKLQTGLSQKQIQTLSIQNIQKKQPKQNSYVGFPKKRQCQKLILMGNRGSGKTTVARMLCSQLPGTHLIDMDDQITKYINENYRNCKTITDLVEQKGWEQFRNIQRQLLDKFVQSSTEGAQQVVISTGGGVVDWPSSVKLLKNSSSIPKIYLQKNLQSLQIQLSPSRPVLPNFPQLFKSRSLKYEQLSDYIITIPDARNSDKSSQYKYKKINQYVMGDMRKIIAKCNGQSDRMKQGLIYCVPRVYDSRGQPINWSQQQEFINHNYGIAGSTGQQINIGKTSGVQLRIDCLIDQLVQMNPSKYRQLALNTAQLQRQLYKQCRYSIANFKITNYPIIKNLSILLTLRTRKQMGYFPHSLMGNKDGYGQWITLMHKIGCDYIDIQYDRLKEVQTRSSMNYMYSYHGSNPSTISDMLNKSSRLMRNSKNMMKICYKGQWQIWENNYKNWQKQSDICINLNNPLSRIHPLNRYRMTIRNNDNSSMIKIPNANQMNMLAKLSKYFLL